MLLNYSIHSVEELKNAQLMLALCIFEKQEPNF